jgi:hypothetical protein
MKPLACSNFSIELSQRARHADAGTLAESWRQEPGSPAYGAPYGPFDNEGGIPASAGVIRAALAAATRKQPGR